MMMKVRINPSSELSLPINTVEFITKKDGSEVGLTTLCRDTEELTALQGLNVSGKQIEIEGPEVLANQSPQPTPPEGG